MKKAITLLLLMMASMQALAQSTDAERKGLVVEISAGVGISSISGDAPGL